MDESEQKMLEQILCEVRLRNNSMDTILKRMEIFESLQEEYDKLHCIVVGDGTKGNLGLVADVALIQKWIDTRTWFERVMAVAVIGEFVAMLFLAIKFAFTIP